MSLNLKAFVHAREPRFNENRVQGELHSNRVSSYSANERRPIEYLHNLTLKGEELSKNAYGKPSWYIWVITAGVLILSDLKDFRIFKRFKL